MDKKERAEWVLESLAHTDYDTETAKFRANPSRKNWRSLIEAVLVLQAWHQRRSSEAEAREPYEDWLERMHEAPITQAQAEIFRRAHGKELSNYYL